MKKIGLIIVFMTGMLVFNLDANANSSGAPQLEPSEHTCFNITKFVRGSTTLIFDCSDCVQKKLDGNKSQYSSMSKCTK